MRPDFDGGRLRPPHHRQLPLHLARDGRQVRLHVAGDTGSREEVRQVGVSTLRVQVHQLGPHDGEPRAADDVGLHGGVGDVVGLHLVVDFTSESVQPLARGPRCRMSTDTNTPSARNDAS